MRCAKAKKLLSLYVDGGLREGHQSAVQEHLHGCAGCRAELEGLQEALRVLHRLPDLKPPVQFRRAVINGVRQAAYDAQAGRRQRVPVFSRPRLAYAAAAVVLVVLGIVIGRMSTTSVPTPVPAPRVANAVDRTPEAPPAPWVTENRTGPEPPGFEAVPGEARPAPRRLHEHLVRYAPAPPGLPVKPAGPVGPAPGAPSVPAGGVNVPPRVLLAGAGEIPGPNQRRYLASGFLVFKPLPSTETPEMGEAKAVLFDSVVVGHAVSEWLANTLSDDATAKMVVTDVVTPNDLLRAADSPRLAGEPPGSS